MTSVSASTSAVSRKSTIGASRGELALASVVTVATAWLWMPLARIGVDMHHDGIMLKPALDVLAGQVLFRDTFSQYGPLTTQIQAVGLWFAPTLLTLKVMSVAAMAAALFFFYAAWREVLPRSLAVAAVLLAGVFVPFFHPDWMVMPWSSDYAMLFQSVALFAMLRALGEGGGRWGWLCGVGIAATFWCRQPVGLTLAIAAGFTLAAAFATGWRAPGKRGTVRVLVGVAGGALAVSALMVGGMAMNGALSYWWEQNIVWPSRWADPAIRGFNLLEGQYAQLTLNPGAVVALLVGLLATLAPWLAERISGRRFGWRVIGVYWAGLLMVAWLAWWSWRGWFVVPGAGWSLLAPAVIFAMCAVVVTQAVISRVQGRRPDAVFFQTAALAGLSLASLAQYYPVPCPRHVFWALAMGCGVFVLALWRWTRVPSWALAAGLALLLVPAVLENRGWAGYVLKQPGVVMERPAALAGMKVGAEEAVFYEWLDDVHAEIEQVAPGRGVVLFGDDAIMLVPARTRANPGPYHVSWFPAMPSAEQRMRWNWILQHRPAIIAHRFETEKLAGFVTNERYYLAASYPEAEVEVFVPLEWREEFVAPTR